MVVMAPGLIVSSTMSFGAPSMTVLTSTGSIAETLAGLEKHRFSSNHRRLVQEGVH